MCKWTTFSEEQSKHSRTISAASTSIDRDFGVRLRKAANEMIDGVFEEVHDPAPPEHTPDTKMPTNPATPESASLLFEGSVFQAAEAPIIATTSTETSAASTDVPLSRERSKIEPTDTVGTVVTSADAPPSPEVPRLQAGEAAVTATTVIETPLLLESTETPPFPPESLPTERPVTAVASTEVPRSPEEPTQPWWLFAWRPHAGHAGLSGHTAGLNGQEPNPLLCDEHHEI